MSLWEAMVVQLKINDQWMVTSDSHNFILQQLEEVSTLDSETRKPTGEIKHVWKNSGYFWTLEQALTSYLQKDIKSQDDVDIQQLIRVIKNAEKVITDAVKGSTGA